MLKKLAVSLIAAGGLMVATAPAQAEGRVSFSIGVGVPLAVYGPPPAYYDPPPVYYPPQPEYYGPPPVVYAPPPRYYAPAVIYRPSPAYYGAGFGWRNGWEPGYGRRGHDHDGWRGHDRGHHRGGGDDDD